MRVLEDNATKGANELFESVPHLPGARTDSDPALKHGDPMNIRTTSNAARAAAVLVALAAAAGCASTSMSDQQQMVAGPLPRPGQIWVYPFAATPADVRPESALISDPEVVAAPQSAEQIAEGRQLGAQIATQVAQEIIGMGMPAAVGSAASRPQINDLVIEGSLLSVQQGSAAGFARSAMGSSCS